MATVVRLTSRELTNEMEKLERQYRMSSLDFFEKYQAGEMGDEQALLRWAWLCSVALRRGQLSRLSATP